MEAVRLRVKDVDFQMKQVTVRSGKGDKDRFTTLPVSLIPALENQTRKARVLHEQDLAMIYTHVLQQGGQGVPSPLDDLTP